MDKKIAISRDVTNSETVNTDETTSHYSFRKVIQKYISRPQIFTSSKSAPTEWCDQEYLRTDRLSGNRRQPQIRRDCAETLIARKRLYRDNDRKYEDRAKTRIVQRRGSCRDNDRVETTIVQRQAIVHRQAIVQRQLETVGDHREEEG